MAINQTEKRRSLARNLAQQAAAFMDVLYRQEDLARQYSAADLTFADADFENIAGLQHLSAADITALLSAIVQMGKFVRGNATAASGNHIAAFEKARP